MSERIIEDLEIVRKHSDIFDRPAFATYVQAGIAEITRLTTALEVMDVGYEAMQERAVEAEAIVDKLPKTADGVTVVPGDRVWIHAKDILARVEEMVGAKTHTIATVRWTTDWETEGGYDVAVIREGLGIVDCGKAVSECYSTREAAEAARK